MTQVTSVATTCQRACQLGVFGCSRSIGVRCYGGGARSVVVSVRRQAEGQYEDGDGPGWDWTGSRAAGFATGFITWGLLRNTVPFLHHLLACWPDDDSDPPVTSSPTTALPVKTSCPTESSNVRVWLFGGLHGDRVGLWRTVRVAKSVVPSGGFAGRSGSGQIAERALNGSPEVAVTILPVSDVAKRALQGAPPTVPRASPPPALDGSAAYVRSRWTQWMAADALLSEISPPRRVALPTASPITPPSHSPARSDRTSSGVSGVVDADWTDSDQSGSAFSSTSSVSANKKSCPVVVADTRSSSQIWAEIDSILQQSAAKYRLLHDAKQTSPPTN